MHPGPFERPRPPAVSAHSNCTGLCGLQHGARALVVDGTLSTLTTNSWTGARSTHGDLFRRGEEFATLVRVAATGDAAAARAAAAETAAEDRAWLNVVHTVRAEARASHGRPSLRVVAAVAAAAHGGKHGGGRGTQSLTRTLPLDTLLEAPSAPVPARGGSTRDRRAGQLSSSALRSAASAFCATRRGGGGGTASEPRSRAAGSRAPPPAPDAALFAYANAADAPPARPRRPRSRSTALRLD